MDFLDESQHRSRVIRRARIYPRAFGDVRLDLRRSARHFPPAKRAEDFDVQRDHARLLNFCGERLLPDGVIVFSNNFRRFKLDEAGLSSFAVNETTAATIPFDFTRNPRIHRVWELYSGSAIWPHKNQLNRRQRARKFQWVFSAKAPALCACDQRVVNSGVNHEIHAYAVFAQLLSAMCVASRCAGGAGRVCTQSRQRRHRIAGRQRRLFSGWHGRGFGYVGFGGYYGGYYPGYYMDMATARTTRRRCITAARWCTQPAAMRVRSMTLAATITPATAIAADQQTFTDESQAPLYA